MQTLSKHQFNAKMAKEKGYQYFKKNVEFLAVKGIIGERINGSIVGPTAEEIKAKYNEVIGVGKGKPQPEEAEVSDKTSGAKPDVESKKSDK